MKSESSGDHEVHFLYDHCKDLGAVASLKGREVNWNTCDLWQNLRYFLESIDDTHFPGTREVLMDSGVSILNFSTCRKVLSLKSITGLHLW